MGRGFDHSDRLAIVDEGGSFTYRDLIEASGSVASVLLDGAEDLEEKGVAFLIPSGFSYVKVQWGIWRAGGIAVPLCTSHPRPELGYVIKDSDAKIVISDPSFAHVSRPIAEENGLRHLSTSDLEGGREAPLPKVSPDRRAMIIYTSGTTGRPKGAVLTHGNIKAQIENLISAWEWRSEDRILNVLPLHHIHGIVNIVCCALWAGAVCEMMTKFDAGRVWERFVESDLTLFMAVPTIYSKLITAWENAPPEKQKIWSKACGKMRVMISGSAALPVPVLEKWRAISGHTLLERYGMTEIGMALTNPLHGERLPAHVGTPIPGIELRLVDEEGSPVEPGTPGEIEVKGPGIFLEYWRRPEETEAAFRDGWFQTGDVAVEEEGRFRMLGRKNLDIIKTGGYKVSALEIEDAICAHPDIEECAVVGVPDPEWGERVAAALVMRRGASLDSKVFRDWVKEQIAPYKVPTRIVNVESLPRNAIGKVTKTQVVELFQSREQKESM